MNLVWEFSIDPVCIHYLSIHMYPSFLSDLGPDDGRVNLIQQSIPRLETFPYIVIVHDIPVIAQDNGLPTQEGLKKSPL